MDDPTSRARQPRSEQTPPEAILWKRLRNRQLAGLEFRRQHPIDRFVVDFACPEARLVVEVDSRYHDGRKEADAARDAVLAGHDWLVVRVSAGEVATSLPGVLGKILEHAGRRLEGRQGPIT